MLPHYLTLLVFHKDPDSFHFAGFSTEALAIWPVWATSESYPLFLHSDSLWSECIEQFTCHRELFQSAFFSDVSRKWSNIPRVLITLVTHFRWSHVSFLKQKVKGTRNLKVYMLLPIIATIKVFQIVGKLNWIKKEAVLHSTKPGHS